MIHNYLNYIKGIENTKRENLGQSIIIKKPISETVVDEVESIPFYNRSSNQDESAATIGYENVSLQVILDWITELQLEQAHTGKMKVGDVNIEASIDDKDIIEEAVNSQYSVIIDGLYFIPESFSTNKIGTKIKLFCSRDNTQE